MTRISPLSALVFAACLISATAHADGHQPEGAAGEVNMPAPSTTTETSVPRRGMSMTQVKAAWGSPENQLGAVGQPPITRWIYDGFTVYFEHRSVIHSVQHARSAQST